MSKHLASSISSPGDLVAFGGEELGRMRDEHREEITRLHGAIEASDDKDWKRRATTVLRYLKMHHEWIVRAAHNRTVERAQEKRTARVESNIMASGDRNAKQIAIFKSVALEVLGDEMYRHLWRLTEQRLANDPH